MKKITPFLFALFICVGANAQVDRQNNSGKIDLNTKFVKSDLKTGPRSSRVEYVYETFDTEIPATWTIQNLGEGTMPGWFWKETDTRIPSIGFAIIDSDNNSAGSLTAGYLYTPFFNCTAAPNLFLEFDVRYRDVTPGGYDVFLVDIWDGSSWQNIINWDDNHGTMTEAEHIKINIAAYKNAECRVRFSYTDANEWLWFAAIDNVLISELENNDLGTNSISSKGFITAGYSTTLSVTIENRGINAQSTYDIKLVSTPAGYNETISNPGTIAAGNTLVVDFPSWTPEAVGNYTLTATVILAGDANPGNNVITSEVEVKILGFGTPVLTFETSTNAQAGVETDGNYIYCSTFNSPYFYKYTMDGVFVKSFTITGVENIRDLTYNPTTQYFYGSNATTTIYEMEFENEYLIRTFTCPTVTRAIFYDDDNDMFWGNNWSSDLIAFYDGGGGQGSTMSTTSIFGATYDNWSDPANPTFWKFTSDAGTPSSTILEAEFDEYGSHTGRQINPVDAPGYDEETIGGGLASFEKDGVAYLLADFQQMPNLIVMYYLAPTSPISGYDVKFRVKDGTNPIQANIVVTGLEIDFLSTPTGVLQLVGIEPAKYIYSVSKEGFATYTGIFEVVDQDIEVNVNLSPLSIESIDANVSIGPNPTKGIINVTANQNYLIEVYDLTGRVIQSVNMTNHNASIDITSESNGMYIIRFTNENGTGTVKVIKK